jgi:trehalose synthase-fused probable maltokinase
VVRADLLTDAAALLQPEWLSAQRWYGANDRRLVSVRPVDAAPLPPRGPEAAAAWLLVGEAKFLDGGILRYLVPAVRDAAGFREPADGDGAWAAMAAAIADGAVVNAEAGSFRCETLPEIEVLLPAGPASVHSLAERRVSGEQTNTSVLLGDRLMLKVYRRLEQGENPELEVGAFLASVGCQVTPAMAGSVRYLAGDGSPAAAAAMLQERVASVGDAWGWMVRLLGENGAQDEALAAAHEIGRVTAELHRSLAARPGDVAFPVRPATAAEVAGWRAGARAQLEGAVAAAVAVGEARGRDLARRRSGLAARLERAFAGAGRAPVMRVHGDYHLGQLLVTAESFAIIDFEGEPARSLAERRRPQPAERDLAGMLRSFDYAARTAERQAGGDGGDVEAWLARARESFLAAYVAHGPRPPDASLLAGFELEKACYEIRYEAANRPDWIWLPLDALDRLAT